jgi:hypothetical protein
MTTYSNGEAYGSKALTWTIIAATALLLVEVTWPQAISAIPAGAPSVQTVSVAAHPDRLARAE